MNLTDPSTPPVYINRVNGFKAMNDNLNKVIEDEKFYPKPLSNNTVKINTKTSKRMGNIRHSVSKEPLPMFFVNLEPLLTTTKIII